MFGARITGPYGGLRVNGFDVGTLINAELDRRYPDRHRLEAETADELRDAIDYLDSRRAATLDRCLGVDEARLQARTPDGEWSVVENLRHLLSAEDQWARCRAFGHEARSPLGNVPDVDEDSGPAVSFAQVVEELEHRQAEVRDWVSRISDADLSCHRAAGAECGDWDGTTGEALRMYLKHEWDHHVVIAGILDDLEA